MNPLEFLNQNPALTSLIAFPLGLILLLGVLKLFGFDLKDFLKALNDHTAAEIKIEAQLAAFVGQVKQLVEADSNYRLYIDEHLEKFTEQNTKILSKLDTILRLIPKREGEQWHEER